MSLEEIQAIVLDVLREVQTLSGRQWVGFDPDAEPIGQLDGFDSLCAVEVTVMVEERLGCGDLHEDTVFVSGKRALTVKQTAQWISKLLAAKGGKA
jgi:acyl carrier protein